MTTRDDTADTEPRPPLGIAGQLVRGFAMGSADLVPGVSGGTVALVLGIYERLVDTVRDGAVMLGTLLRGQVREGVARFRAIDWRFLLPLLGGILAAIVTLAGLLGTLLDEHPVAMSGFFAGLVAGSIVVTLPDVRRWDATRGAVLVGVAVLTFFVLGLRGSSHDEAAVVALVGAGAVAICAMILPGISGSFILLMIGLYDHVLDLVHERRVLDLAAVALGAVTGLALFSTGLSWLIDNHRDTVIAALIGLMAGSLRVLWPWPATSGVGDTRIEAPGDAIVAATLLALGAFVVVLAVGRWGRVRTPPTGEHPLGADRGVPLSG
ncbi:MAG: DUF368 domain-containing protein [Actinobacteria bacterium]|nr:DUF368 domain-containing protein [Actinomycetota bacterium]